MEINKEPGTLRIKKGGEPLKDHGESTFMHMPGTENLSTNVTAMMTLDNTGEMDDKSALFVSKL